MSAVGFLLTRELHTYKWKDPESIGSNDKQRNNGPSNYLGMKMFGVNELLISSAYLQRGSRTCLTLSHVNERARDDYKVFSNVTDRSSAGLSGRAEQIPQLLLMTGLKSQGSEAAWLPTSSDLSSEVSLGPAQTHSSQKRKEQVAISFFPLLPWNRLQPSSWCLDLWPGNSPPE